MAVKKALCSIFNGLYELLSCSFVAKVLFPIALGICGMLINAYILCIIVNKSLALLGIAYHVVYLQALLFIVLKPILGLNNYTTQLMDMAELIKNQGKQPYESEIRHMIVSWATNIFFYVFILGLVICIEHYLK